MSDKLSPAQTAVLDLVTLKGEVRGVAVVPKDASGDVVSLSTARSLVKKGYLTEKAKGIFELAPGEDVAKKRVIAELHTSAADREPGGRPSERRIQRVIERTRRSFAVELDPELGLLTALNGKQHRGGHIYAGTVPSHVKAKRRAAGKAAKASRRANRRSS